MEKLDFLFCIRGNYLRNYWQIQHVFHRINTFMKGMLKFNPCNQMKLEFSLGGIHSKEKGCSYTLRYTLNGSTLLNCCLSNFKHKVLIVSFKAPQGVFHLILRSVHHFWLASGASLHCLLIRYSWATHFALFLVLPLALSSSLL